jgi:hypothetical protein
MSWRDELPVHPAAELFPPMTGQELDDLAVDIKKNGLKIAVVIYIDPEEKSWFLEGRNRLDAMEKVGLPVPLSGPGLDAMVKIGTVKLERNIDPYAYVMSANIHRRHLTADQKRDLIAKLLTLDPGKTDRQIAKPIKASPTTVGKVRKQLEDTGDVSKLDTRFDAHGRQQPAHKPKRASKIRKLNPDNAQASADARKARLAADEAPAQRIEREELDNVVKLVDFTPPDESARDSGAETLVQLAEPVRAGHQKAEHGLAEKILGLIECLVALTQEVSAARVFVAAPDGPPNAQELEQVAAWCTDLARRYREGARS